MTNKLSDWLDILQHPEVGKRICGAAGCQVSPGVDLDGAPAVWLWWDYEQDSGLDTLTVAEAAALAFGTLAVLAEDGFTPTIERYGLHFGDGELEDEPTLPAAVLAAAKRVWMKGDE